MSTEPRTERLESALARILNWSHAYPVAVFPETDADYLKNAAIVLTAAGMSLDRISASNMRHVISQVGKIAADALEIGP